MLATYPETVYLWILLVRNIYGPVAAQRIPNMKHSLRYSKEAHIQLINADSEADGRISGHVALHSCGLEHR
jgi:hypothetical protein